MDAPTSPLTRLSQSLQKQPAILVISENGLTMAAASHHMVNGSGILNTQRSGHLPRCILATNSPLSIAYCHNSRTDPFTIVKVAKSVVYRGICGHLRQNRTHNTHFWQAYQGFRR